MKLSSQGRRSTVKLSTVKLCASVGFELKLTIRVGHVDAVQAMVELATSIELKILEEYRSILYIFSFFGRARIPFS